MISASTLSIMLDELACDLYAGPTRKGEYAKNEFDFETVGCQLDDSSIGRLLEAFFRGSASAVLKTRACKDRTTTQNSVGDKGEDTIPALFVCDIVR